jgi:hypothetical protein
VHSEPREEQGSTDHLLTPMVGTAPSCMPGYVPAEPRERASFTGPADGPARPHRPGVPEGMELRDRLERRLQVARSRAAAGGGGPAEADDEQPEALHRSTPAELVDTLAAHQRRVAVRDDGVSPPPCTGRSTSAIAVGAPSRGVTRPGTSTPTTCGTGATAARPTSATSCSSAPATTGWSTTVPGGSRSGPTAATGSPHRGAPPSPLADPSRGQPGRTTRPGAAPSGPERITDHVRGTV